MSFVAEKGTNEVIAGTLYNPINYLCTFSSLSTHLDIITI